MPTSSPLKSAKSYWCVERPATSSFFARGSNSYLVSKMFNFAPVPNTYKICGHVRVHQKVSECFFLPQQRQIWYTKKIKTFSCPSQWFCVDQRESDYFINNYPCSLLLLRPACFRLLVAREVFARPPVFVVTTRPWLGNLLHNFGFMSRKWCSLTSFRPSVFNPLSLTFTLND